MLPPTSSRRAPCRTSEISSQFFVAMTVTVRAFPSRARVLASDPAATMSARTDVGNHACLEHGEGGG